MYSPPAIPTESWTVERVEPADLNKQGLQLEPGGKGVGSGHMDGELHTATNGLPVDLGTELRTEDFHPKSRELQTEKPVRSGAQLKREQSSEPRGNLPGP